MSKYSSYPRNLVVEQVIAHRPDDRRRPLPEVFCELWNTHPASRGEGVTSNWQVTVERWENAGLTIEEMTEFLDYILTRPDIPGDDRWKYFCGCCWGATRGRKTGGAA